jgi:4-amino-4-deoxy-L-arabinose transferase-like glycosyltransferase
MVTTEADEPAAGKDAAARWRIVGGPFVAAGLVGVGAVAVCLWRLMPGLGFWDTAEFQMVLPVMGTAHPTGYPSYVLLGWLASVLLQPLGEAALRMNVLSAILVGIGAAFTTDLARRLSGSLVLGVVAGVGTALTPIVWAIGTRADPHALHFAFVAIILWLLVRWQ